MPGLLNNLSDEDQKALGQYVDTNPKQQMLQQSQQWAQNDPTLQNMLQGIAGGTLGGEGKIIGEAAESEVVPAFQRLRSMLQGESPSASSAGENALANQQAYVSKIENQLGYFHPEVKQQQAILNRMKFGQ